MKALFDLEADGFLDKATKIHCVSYINLEDIPGGVHTIYGDGPITEFFNSCDTVVGHNIVGYDLPILRKLLGLGYKGRVIDTLPLSWYIYPERNASFGLAAFGEEYGVPKPVIEDWSEQTLADYTHRCEEDVKINLTLWQDIDKKLTRLYYMEEEGKDRVIDYLTFKMELAQKQEEQGWDFDLSRAEVLKEKLDALVSEKFEALADAMPENVIKEEKRMPKVMQKADGSPSALALKWYDFLAENGLSKDRTEPVSYIKKTERGNPKSTVQVKEWLTYLGWKPQTFNFTRDKDGNERVIPQVRTGDKELCPSVKVLAKRDPAINLLDGYTVLVHRQGIVKSFLENEVGGKLKARVHGLTNTFRFKHVAPLVNLPGVDKDYGPDIRGLLTAPTGKALCGSDMVSLEDTTKRHYMAPLDPDYCRLMEAEDWDPHLDLAKFAGAITQEQIDIGGPRVKSIRKSYKAANYASVYGVGARTLSRSTGLTENEAGKLIDAYWKRNWAVKEVADNIPIRKIKRGKKMLMWVQNPISGFWHNLRAEKDVWSTINQSSGVYCFDRWVYHLTRREIWPIGQFHDEVIAVAPQDKDQQEEMKYDLEQAMVDANAELKLNVTLGIDVQFGENYSEIH